MIIDKKNTEDLEQWITSQRERVIADAQRMSKVFWEFRNNLLDEKISEDKKSFRNPKLGCAITVSKKDNGIRITWYRFQFHNVKIIDAGIPKTIKRRTNIYLTRPKKGYAYNLNKLKKYAHPKEYRIIEMCEDVFAECRQRLDIIRKFKIDLYNWKIATGILEKRTKNQPKKLTNVISENTEKKPVDFESFGEDK